MEKIIDTLLQDIKENFDEEALGELLSNIYALGRFDGEAERESEATQVVLLMSPTMKTEVVYDYIFNRLDEYIDEADELLVEDEDDDDDFPRIPALYDKAFDLAVEILNLEDKKEKTTPPEPAHRIELSWDDFVEHVDFDKIIETLEDDPEYSEEEF